MKQKYKMAYSILLLILVMSLVTILYTPNTEYEKCLEECTQTKECWYQNPIFKCQEVCTNAISTR